MGKVFDFSEIKLEANGVGNEGERILVGGNWYIIGEATADIDEITLKTTGYSGPILDEDGNKAGFIYYFVDRFGEEEECGDIDRVELY